MMFKLLLRIHISISFFLLFAGCLTAQAQSTTLRLYNNWNINQLYKDSLAKHTAWKPALYTDSTVAPSTKSWLHRKFFEEHLLSVQQPSFALYGDIIVDEYIGYDNRAVTLLQSGKSNDYHSPEMNTRGYEVSGSFGKKIYFETNFYENQGRFAAYTDSFVRKYKMVPRQARYKPERIGDGPGFDFNYSNTRIIYTPDTHLLFDLGYGRNFIGDGYRSMLLSDFSTDHPYLRTALTFNKFQYTVLWSQYTTSLSQAPDLYAYGYPRKWGQTYLADWQVSKRFTVSLFESVVWAGQDAQHRNDIGITYASPVIFLHAGKSKSGVQNNELTGLNLKYKIASNIYLYGQAAADELGKNAKNRYAAQVGIRAADLLKISNWNAQIEFNTARPYTYSSDTNQTSYSHSLIPLAHPLGANFKELLGVTDYTYNSWWFRLEAFAAHYGNDVQGFNYGHDIFNTSTNYPAGNITTGQGAPAKLYFGDLRIAYILNKKTNLRLETGFTYRRETNAAVKHEDMIATIGVRMSFRNLQYDF